MKSSKPHVPATSAGVPVEMRGVSRMGGRRSAAQRQSPRAFTLIEMAGTLAVITILATVTCYHLLEHLKRTMRKTEQAELQKFSEGFKQCIRRTRTVPAPTGWAQPVADELGMVLTDVTLNKVKNPRVMLVDPNFRIGNTQPASLPYTQGIRGVTNGLTSARVLLISSLNNPLPEAIASPGTNSYFDAIWESVDETVPSFWTNIGGLNWPDIEVQRIALEPLFVRLTLNYDGTLQGRYGVDNSDCASSVTLPQSPFSAHFIASTRLSLFGYSCALSNALQSTETLLESHSYAFQNGIWRGRLFLGTTAKRLNGRDLQEAYDLFMAATPNANAKFGTVQVDCAAAMIEYMQQYILWAGNGFGNNPDPRDTQTELAWNTANFIWKSSSQSKNYQRRVPGP